MWYQIVVCVCFAVLNANAQTLGGYCRTPLSEGAKCVSVYTCKTLLPLISLQSRTPEQTQFLHASRCGFDTSGTPYVCCGTKITADDAVDTGASSNYPNPLVPDRESCGLQVTNKIFGGEETAIDEFPWMVVFQYLKPTGERKIACAGSLINKRYVLTAAHCVTGEVNTKVGQLINIRLGEYDTNNPGRDCVVFRGVRICNNDEVNVGIERIIPHPNYNGEDSRFHDIALVRLARDVQFTNFIQPICLPQPDEASPPGKMLIVAGWGKTEKGRNSNVKLKLEVPVTTDTQCSNAFSPLGVRIGSGHICAGGLAGKDSCTGDSGGPLMRTLPSDTTRWMIEGLVSFGYNFCGTPGYPGVYTRIAKYVTWIHSNIRP